MAEVAARFRFDLTARAEKGQIDLCDPLGRRHAHELKPC